MLIVEDEQVPVPERRKVYPVTSRPAPGLLGHSPPRRPPIAAVSCRFQKGDGNGVTCCVVKGGNETWNPSDRGTASDILVIIVVFAAIGCDGGWIRHFMLSASFQSAPSVQNRISCKVMVV